MCCDKNRAQEMEWEIWFCEAGHKLIIIIWTEHVRGSHTKCRFNLIKFFDFMKCRNPCQNIVSIFTNTIIHSAFILYMHNTHTTYKMPSTESKHLVVHRVRNTNNENGHKMQNEEKRRKKAIFGLQLIDNGLNYGIIKKRARAQQYCTFLSL